VSSLRAAGDVEGCIQYSSSPYLVSDLYCPVTYDTTRNIYAHSKIIWIPTLTREVADCLAACGESAIFPDAAEVYNTRMSAELQRLFHGLVIYEGSCKAK